MIFKHEWSRLLTYALVILFGTYSIIEPIVSVDRTAPTWATTLLGAEFAVAGVLLMLGMGKRQGLRMIGLVVVSVGLFTISAIIAFAGGVRVLSYAFLFAAFAMDSVNSIVMERRAKRNIPEELNALVEELKSARNGKADDT